MVLPAAKEAPISSGALLVDRSLHGGQRDLVLFVSQGFGHLQGGCGGTQ